eukprot:GHVU01085982.1.p2 GENE.GHVU01085982.1~~GHVU01085982.1.p2  ORF type:complete len:132 (-),score=9.47 GHVU01085982.1:678-1073(-)
MHARAMEANGIQRRAHVLRHHGGVASTLLRLKGDTLTRLPPSPPRTHATPPTTVWLAAASLSPPSPTSVSFTYAYVRALRVVDAHDDEATTRREFQSNQLATYLQCTCNRGAQQTQNNVALTVTGASVSAS